MPVFTAERCLRASRLPVLYLVFRQVPREEDIENLGIITSGTATTDTEADDTAQPAGAGPRGQGPPLQVHRGRRARPLQDGGGLCSPGQWAPTQRPLCRAPRIMAVRAALHRELQALQGHPDGDQVAEIFDGITRGACQESPFPADRTAALLSYCMELYGEEAAPREGDRPMNIRARLIQAMLRDSADADYAAIDQIAPGVPIGVNVRLPRTPAVYPRKKKWNLRGQEDPDAWRVPWGSGSWQRNYGSADAVQDELEKQLDELVRLDKAGRATVEQIKTWWPDAAVASLGALVQLRPDGDLKVRALYDGTRGVDINPKIRVRDKDRGPATADVRCVMRQLAKSGRRAVGIKADVKDAHREIPVREADWKLQICRARPSSSTCYYFKVGVFGISSAAYWWGRLAACLVRLLHHVGEPSLDVWVLLVADDFKMESSATNPARSLLFLLWLLVIVGVPLQWGKTAGGQRIDWVGYSFDLAQYTLGLSESRAAWAVAWCTKQADNGGGTLGELREGVGRLGFAAGALLFDAPFLSPLYAYLGVCRTTGYRKYPVFVRITLRFLADRIARRRSYNCATTPSPLEFGPRVDAAAQGDIIGIGGWLPRRGPAGEISLADSPWFAISLDINSAPWAFSKNGQPFRSIAALEALATLLAVKLFSPWLHGDLRGSVTLKAYTDNQGNVAALGRLATTKYPLNCVIMELSTILESLNLTLDLRWLPREFNGEADQLSKGCFEGFADAHRVRVTADQLAWNVLPDLMKQGELFHREIVSAKAAAPAPPPARKKRRGERLRDVDPW